MKNQPKQKLSIVVPMYNEAQCIDAFFQRLLDVIAPLNFTYEIICVDDGSTDATCALIKPWISINPNIKVIRLTRNFGKERALAAGIDHASGDAVIPIDADLQDPPEVIPDLLEKWREGFKMVIASRSSRPGDTHLKRLSASSFYRIMNHFSEMALPANAGDFRLMDRCVVDALKRLPERTRFHKGLFAWLGFETATVYYARPERVMGQTKWHYWKLWNYALEGIFSFSTAPLKLWTYVRVHRLHLCNLYRSPHADVWYRRARLCIPACHPVDTKRILFNRHWRAGRIHRQDIHRGETTPTLSDRFDRTESGRDTN